MKKITIGQLAKQCGVGVETIRSYEREGLIEEQLCREPGCCQYQEKIASRIRFIKRAKEFGFTLKEIKELLAIRMKPEATCSDFRRQAEAKITDIEKRIAMLQRIIDHGVQWARPDKSVPDP